MTSNSGASLRATGFRADASSQQVVSTEGFNPARLQPAYLTLAERTLQGVTCAKAGEVVFAQYGYDYGLASDDTRWTGIEHVSVTLNSDGDYPGFTIPKADLLPLTSEQTAILLSRREQSA